MRLHALGLREVHVVAALHGAHGALAGVLVGESPDHVVEQALAHGAVGDPQLLDLEHAQDFHQDRQAAGEHRPPILGQGRKFEFAYVTRLTDVADDLLEPRHGDGLGHRIELAHHIADGAHRAGTAIGGLPAAAPVGHLHRFQFQPRGHARAVQPFRRQLAVAEEAFAQGHAAHLQALQLQRLRALADDEFGAAAADVAYQAAAGLGRHGVRDAGVDEARLFHAGDDFDGMAEGLAGALQEGLLAARAAQRVGADHADTVGVHVTQALPEALQAGEGARRHILVDAAVLFDTRTQPHHLAQPVHDDDLAVDVARHDHVETVGSQVDGREDVRNRKCGHARSR